MGLEIVYFLGALVLLATLIYARHSAIAIATSRRHEWVIRSCATATDEMRLRP
jgi:hypothetical protein